MGTEEKNKITELIKKLGWSKRKFAYEIYALELPDGREEDEGDIQRFYDTFKKQLTYDTQPEEFVRYLRLISQHEEVKKANIIVPCFYKTGLFPDDKTDFMLEISKAATKLARSTIETKIYPKK